MPNVSDSTSLNRVLEFYKPAALKVNLLRWFVWLPKHRRAKLATRSRKVLLVSWYSCKSRCWRLSCRLQFCCNIYATSAKR